MDESENHDWRARRLSAVDASFLYAEREGGHTHIGAIARFSGKAPTAAELRRHVESRLHLVPRFRQRLHTPWPLARPLWVDSVDLDLDYHVQAARLPDGVGLDGLRAFAARLFSQRLDRSKPLWEMWCVDGYDDDAFALVSKVHHAVLDGASGMWAAGAIFDFAPKGSPTDGPMWRPEPAPTAIGVATEGFKALARSAAATARLPWSVAQDPPRARRELAKGSAAVSELATLALTAEPREQFDRQIDSHRRLAWLSCDLGQLKQVKEKFGGTVNDVFVAAVTGALGTWLRRQGVDTFNLRPRALVPVSTRGDGPAGEMGNQLTALVVPLPVDLRNPQTRLAAVRGAIDRAKRSRQAVAGKTIAAVEELAPTPLLPITSRLHYSNRIHSVLVSNVRGPQVPLYLLGRRLEELAPVPFLAPGKAFGLAILTYDGLATVGLITDGAGDDLELLAGDLRNSLDELILAAGQKPKRHPSRRTNRFRRRSTDAVPAADDGEEGEHRPRTNGDVDPCSPDRMRDPEKA